MDSATANQFTFYHTNVYELGTRFSVAQNGTVLNLITYVHQGDTTSFVGKIWDTTSTSSPYCTTGSTTFTTGGWLTITFLNCRIIPGREYVVSINYEDTTSGFPATAQNFFVTEGSPIISGDLAIIEALYTTTPGTYPTLNDNYYYSQGINFVKYSNF